MKKRIFSLLFVILLLFSLCACGEKGSKVSDYEGYYIMEHYNNNTNPGDEYYYYSAIEIDKKGNMIYRIGRNYESLALKDSVGKLTGTINVDEIQAFASFYNSNYEGGKSTDFSTFCPLKLTLTSDGDILYVDSDKGGWTADSYNRVKKSKYNSFCKDNMLIDDALSLKCNEIYDEK